MNSAPGCCHLLFRGFMRQRQFLCTVDFYSGNTSSFPFNLWIFSAFTVLCCKNVYMVAMYFCKELLSFVLSLLSADCTCGSSAVGPLPTRLLCEPVLWQRPVKLPLCPNFSKLKNCRLFICSLNRSYSLAFSFFLPFLKLFVTLKHTGKTGALVDSGSQLVV